MDPIIAIALAGGAYVIAESRSPTGSPTVPAPGSRPLPAVSGAAKGVKPLGAPHLITSAGAYGVKPPMVMASSSTYQNASPQSVSQEIVDKVTKKAKDEWNKLTGEAKAAACAKLKAQFPNEPSIQAIDCSKGDFENIMKAAGAVGGVAVCAYFGVGAVAAAGCGAVGSFIASWAGDKVKGWYNDASSQVEDWADDAGNAIGDAVTSGFGLW